MQYYYPCCQGLRAKPHPKLSLCLGFFSHVSQPITLLLSQIECVTANLLSRKHQSRCWVEMDGCGCHVLGSSGLGPESGAHLWLPSAGMLSAVGNREGALHRDHRLGLCQTPPGLSWQPSHLIRTLPHSHNHLPTRRPQRYSLTVLRHPMSLILTVRVVADDGPS